MYVLPVFTDYYISRCYVLEGLLFLNYKDHSARVKHLILSC